MSRKSQEIIGPNVDIPATTESKPLSHEGKRRDSDGGYD
jgi:hypothetical protein